MKRRKVRGPMGEGTLAAAADADEDNRAYACTVRPSESACWLRRIDQGQDVTNVMLEKVVRLVGLLLVEMVEMKKDLREARGEMREQWRLESADTAMKGMEGEKVAESPREQSDTAKAEAATHCTQA
jgi:hypothetical protein